MLIQSLLLILLWVTIIVLCAVTYHSTQEELLRWLKTFNVVSDILESPDNYKDPAKSLVIEWRKAIKLSRSGLKEKVKELDSFLDDVKQIDDLTTAYDTLATRIERALRELTLDAPAKITPYLRRPKVLRTPKEIQRKGLHF